MRNSNKIIGAHEKIDGKIKEKIKLKEKGNLIPKKVEKNS